MFCQGVFFWSLIFKCDCPIEIAAERLKKRNRKDRYTIPDTKMQEKLLGIKERNIEIALSYFKGEVYHLDMTQSVSVLSRTVRKVLKRFDLY